MQKLIQRDQSNLDKTVVQKRKYQQFIINILKEIKKILRFITDSFFFLFDFGKI